MFIRLYRLYKNIQAAKKRKPRPLDRNDPAVQKLIEMIRLFELDQYEVLNPVFHHYRFTFSDGTTRGPISIVEISGYIDLLKEHGLYRRTIKRDEPATVIDMEAATVREDADDISDKAPLNAAIIPFRRDE